MVPELVGKYVFLVQTFVEAGDAGLSWPEVAARWEDRYAEPYASEGRGGGFRDCHHV